MRRLRCYFKMRLKRAVSPLKARGTEPRTKWMLKLAFVNAGKKKDVAQAAFAMLFQDETEESCFPAESEGNRTSYKMDVKARFYSSMLKTFLVKWVYSGINPF